METHGNNGVSRIMDRRRLLILLMLLLGPNELKSLLPFCVGNVVPLVGSLWLVRLAGYRLIWRRRVRL